MSRLDFTKLNQELLSRCPNLLYEWFPKGCLQGNEFKVGNLSGAKGKSLSINTVTSKWADFQSESKGGDLNSLWAAKNNISQGESYKELMKRYGGSMKINKENTKELIKKTHYKYTDTFEVVRKDYKDGGKDIFPHQIDTDTWKWPKYLPIYAPKHDSSKKAFLIVEGEKCVNLALKVFGGSLNVCCNARGSSGAKDCSGWNIIKEDSTQIIIWPDYDAPSFRWAREVFKILNAKGVKNLFIVDPRKDNLFPDKKSWDVADCIETKKMTQSDIFSWLDKTLIEAEEFNFNFQENENGVLPKVQNKPEDTPIPLTQEQFTTTDPPMDCLGDSLAEVGNLMVKELKASKGLVFSSLLSLASIVTQQLRNISIASNTRPISLFFLSIADSGERKTTLMNLIFKSVMDKEEELIGQHEGKERAFALRR